jgi:hypothetical protein
MKKIFSLLFLLFTVALFAQNEQLAQNYFDRGEFEKALISYEDIINTNKETYWLKLGTIINCKKTMQKQKNITTKQLIE